MAYSHHIFFELPILTLGSSEKPAAIKELVDELARLQALPDNLVDLVFRQLLDHEDPPTFALYGYAMPHLSGELDGVASCRLPWRSSASLYKGIPWTSESKHNTRFTADAHAILLLLDAKRIDRERPHAYRSSWWDIAAEIEIAEFLKSDLAGSRCLSTRFSSKSSWFYLESGRRDA